MNDPYVGILVSKQEYDLISQGTPQANELQWYLEAGKQYGVKPCFFCLDDIEPNQMNAYIQEDNRYVLKQIPAPRVIHNRAVQSSPDDDEKIDDWCKDGRIVFNRLNRYESQFVYELLREDLSLQPHLPDQVRATAANLRLMMKVHDKLILIPDGENAGNSEEMSLTRISGNVWKWTYTVKTGNKHVKNNWQFKKSNLPSVLLYWLSQDCFIAKQKVPLPKYRGFPWELRVCVQRCVTGNWLVSGTTYRFTGSSSSKPSVSNLETLLQLQVPNHPPQETQAAIEDFSLRVAGQLTGYLPHQAELILRLGLSPEGKPFWLECLSMDPRVLFRQAGMKENWKATCAHPMGYAKYLIEQRRSSLLEKIKNRRPS